MQVESNTGDGVSTMTSNTGDGVSTLALKPMGGVNQSTKQKAPVAPQNGEKSLNLIVN